MFTRWHDHMLLTTWPDCYLTLALLALLIKLWYGRAWCLPACLVVVYHVCCRQLPCVFLSVHVCVCMCVSLCICVYMCVCVCSICSQWVRRVMSSCLISHRRPLVCRALTTCPLESLSWRFDTLVYNIAAVQLSPTDKQNILPLVHGIGHMTSFRIFRHRLHCRYS